MALKRATLALALAAALAAQAPPANTQPARTQPVRTQQVRPTGNALIGHPAPALARTSLQGTRVDLKALRGKVVLVNFWATWCGPCKVELPQFVQWQREYGSRGLQVVAVSMDDSDAPVRRFVQTLKPGFPVLMGNAKLGRAWGGVLGLPVTFLVARDGTVASRTEGGADLPALESQVKKLLSKP
ncbi:MAG TPA: TlpA disulfide reductase family protein [Terracidiphilus sp.]|nr:TlpA disulfide reductase family protein [Terracidiphilus sp.]